MRRVWLTSFVLFLVTVAVFSRVLLADFVQWDDDISVYQNPHIQGLDWARLQWMFSDAGYAMRYEPLNWLGYAVIHHFSGLRPFGYHLASLVLHGLNTVLLFAVIQRLLAAGGTADQLAGRLEQATFPAALGALLWALNPLRVEPVAHATDLRYCLLLWFLLISLWCYLRAYSSGDQTGGRRVFYWCSVGAYALSMLSLPFACGYAVVLVALDWYPLGRLASVVPGGRGTKARGILLEKAPFLLLGGLVLTTLLARLSPTGIYAAQSGQTALAPFGRVMQAFYVWAYYAWKPWAPLHLSPVYTVLVDFNPNAWRFWLSAALVLGTTGLLVRRRNRWPWALALWVGYLVLLVPVLGLTERPHYTADRYGYLPGVAWAVAIAATLQWLGTRPKLRAAGLAAGIALAVLWGGLSWHQTRVWRNSVALFEYMIRELGDDPYRRDIHWRLGLVLAGEGKTQEAARQYQASLRLEPTPEAHLGFAELLEKNGDGPGALTNCAAALALGPTPLNRIQAGQVLAALGRGAEAVCQYRLALASAPELVPALNNLAWILASDREATNRNGAEAVELAERACALTERQVPVLVGTLAAAYAEAGRFKEAIATAQEARALAQAAGQPEVAEKNRQLLELYQAGRAYHELPPPAASTGRAEP